MEALSLSLRTKCADVFQKIICPVLRQIGFRLVRIQTNSLFPQRCLLWDETYQGSKRVQEDLPAQHAHKLNYIVLNDLTLKGKSKPGPTDREELSELEEDWYWREGLRRRSGKYVMDPHDEDDLAEEGETRAENVPRGLKRERPENMELASTE